MVSFPPLIDMLKFSGYPYLIRGQNCEKGFWEPAQEGLEFAFLLRSKPTYRPPMNLGRVHARRRRTVTHHQAELEGLNDARTGMPQGIPRGAMCVQRFDDSLNSAIHTTYRISLRSSSMPEPRDPLLKVLIFVCFSDNTGITKCFLVSPLAGEPAEETKRYSKRQGFYLDRAEAPR